MELIKVQLSKQMIDFITDELDEDWNIQLRKIECTPKYYNIRDYETDSNIDKGLIYYLLSFIDNDRMPSMSLEEFERKVNKIERLILEINYE